VLTIEGVGAVELYAIRRESGWQGPAELEKAAAISARIGDEEMPQDIRWIRSYVVKEEDGTLGTICIYEASSPEKIREHAQRVGMPADDVLPIADTVVVRPDPVGAAA
jgi:hypothetical protein